jgi:hypothetical protein
MFVPESKFAKGKKIVNFWKNLIFFLRNNDEHIRIQKNNFFFRKSDFLVRDWIVKNKTSH